MQNKAEIRAKTVEGDGYLLEECMEKIVDETTIRQKQRQKIKRGKETRLIYISIIYNSQHFHHILKS